MPRLQQAIPLQDLNIETPKRNRYGRETYVSQEEAMAENAITVILLSCLGVLATCVALWLAAKELNRIEARPAPIMAKSEMTKQQIKQLNVMPTVSEKHHKSR